MSTLKVDTITDSAGTGAPSFTYGISGIAPTQQLFTSGSGTYTTPSNVKYIRVRMVGGGSGGSGSGTGGIGFGTSGGNTTFGSSLLTANGGSAGSGSGSGAGGSATISAPAYGVSFSGSRGGGFSLVPGGGGGSSTLVAGGTGGNSPFGGAGVGNYDDIGTNATANTGSGGGGGGGNNIASHFAGLGGSSGAYIDAWIASPSATYSYAVGSGGTAGNAGTSGRAGGAGAAGIIIVDEYYQ